MKRKKKKDFDNVICKKCGYQNKKHYALYFGTCLCCGNIIDDKSKFIYELKGKLGLWRKEKKDERKITKNN